MIGLVYRADSFARCRTRGFGGKNDKLDAGKPAMADYSACRSAIMRVPESADNDA
jgi:hypothetical protein